MNPFKPKKSDYFIRVGYVDYKETIYCVDKFRGSRSELIDYLIVCRNMSHTEAINFINLIRSDER